MRGEAEKIGGEIRINYAYGGDSYSVVCKKDGVHYTRRGSLGVDMLLREGVRTECLLTDGGLSGAIPVCASEVRIEEGANGTAVFLKYDLGGGETSLRIVVTEDRYPKR